MGAGSANAAEHDSAGRTSDKGSALHRIVRFFESKGLHGNAIAGIVGNLEVESSLNPNAYNPGEGAIGIAQWEGGRRTALEHWAAQHGGSAGELDMQLGYLWHELTTSYRNVLHNIQNAGSARQAAAYWDVGPGGVNSGTGFENSSGSATGERMNFAQQFNQTHSLPESHGGGGTGAAFFGGGGGGGGGNGGFMLTKADYNHVANLGGLLNSVPELRRLVNQAQANGWSLNKFENAVEDSHWWKSHSDTARQVLAQMANDPATYRQNLRQAEFTLGHLAGQLGFTPTPNQLANIARTAVLTGNDSNTDWLSQQLGRQEDYSHIGTRGLNNLNGEMATNVQQLQQIAADYGVNWSAPSLARSAKLIAMGNDTIDGFRQNAIGYAKSAFPSFSKQLDAGQTMMDIAQPYISSASQLLETNPGNFSLYSPLIRQGLQGTKGKPGEPPTALPLWQFEDQVRNDPRWGFTDNAKQSAASMLTQLGQAWGING